MGENLERLPGESIKQWRARIKAQNREQRIQEEIDKGELLDAAIVVAPRSQATVSQGYQTVGRKNNDHRVGQTSVFGEREYDPNPSLAQRFGNWITDGLHLTSPPTFQDGYGRTLNAEVPTWESAQGQELKRMGKTAMTDAAIVTAPFGLYQFYVNPLAMTAAVGTGAAFDWGVGKGVDFLDKELNKSGKTFSEDQKNSIRFLAGLTTGSGAYKWGDAATKRGLEVAMHTSGVPNPMRQIQDGWSSRNWKQRSNVINYILTGKNKNGTSNTLGVLDGEVPTFYTGLNNATNVSGAPEYGRDAVRTYLYGEPLIDFKPVSGNPLGVHSDYVLKHYPNKHIPVYEANQPNLRGRFRPSVDPISFKVEGTTGSIHNVGLTNSDFDAAGHIEETGFLDGDFFTRQQDIWKFNSKDYMDKWLPNNKGRGILKHLPLKWGLDIVDYHGNPFIVRSPWVSERVIDPPKTPASIPAYSKQYTQGKIASDYDIDSDLSDYDIYFDDYVDLELPIYNGPVGPGPNMDEELPY